MKTIIFALIIILVLPLFLKSQIEVDTNVIFIDYDPDIVLLNNDDTLSIDANQDGIFDYLFYYELYSSVRYPYFRNLNPNCKYSLFLPDSEDTLNNPSIEWYSGEWFWYEDIMFGLKINSDNDNFYGWIHASSSPSTIVVDKFAFCKIPDYPFHLGQTTLTGLTSIADISGDIKVFTENAGNTLVIQSEKIMDFMRLISINGTEVFLHNNINSMSAKINVTGIVRGAYIL
ncbi:MAG: hypothetical protein JW731_16640 [Bacteroidales bacterium]|nr:hypothetical protein [Bacteroidales bacterium]